MKNQKKAFLLRELESGKLPESEFVEFKVKWGQDSGKSLSSIGNWKDGGWMIVGVSDKGDVVGFAKNLAKDQKNKVENHISQYLDPVSAVQSISFESVKNKNCVFIEIINPNEAVSWNKKFYKRVGSRTEEMSPAEKTALERKLPGFDFSKMKYTGDTDPALVLNFAKLLKDDNGFWGQKPANEVLSKLGIKDTNTAGILFGDHSFRFVRYNKNSDILDQEEKKGLYHLLKGDFVPHVQSLAKKKPVRLRPGSLSVEEEKPYSPLALREILANAVAHSAFERRGGGLKVELYPDRIEISNHCAPEAEDLINKRFSSESFAKNPLLMKTLRRAGLSEELGTGKSKIFKYVVEDGKKEPLVTYKKTPMNYGIWSVVLYNEQLDKNLLKLMAKLKKQYKAKPDKYKLTVALLLWRNKPLNEILKHMDEHHQKLTKEILNDEQSPFLLVSSAVASGETIHKVVLKRWASLPLKGKESQVLSEGEDQQFRKRLQNYAFQDQRDGYITNRQARRLLGFADSKSEQVQVSRMFQEWVKEGFVEKGKKRGSWRIKA